jgi:hypothetical protein
LALAGVLGHKFAGFSLAGSDGKQGDAKQALNPTKEKQEQETNKSLKINIKNS